MSEVIDFAAAKENNTPHNSGRAICLGCKHEWVGVAPVGHIVLECPSCGTEKGVFQGLVQVDEDHWQCNCGNQFFCFTPTQTYCPVCGTTQKGF